MKILILKPSSLGDVIQALPVLRCLKLHWPAAEIHWWIDAGLVPLLEGDPDLAGVIPFERNRWAALSVWRDGWACLQRIRSTGFDCVIDLQALLRSAALSWAAGAALKVGIADPREGAAAFYDYAVPRPSANAHAVDWYLSVLESLAVPVAACFDWIPARPRVAALVRRKWSIGAEPWVLLQPGARWTNKRWPVAKFAALIRGIAREQPEVRFAVLGSTAEGALGAELATALAGRVIDLCGQASLVEMVEWIRLSAVLVTNDTGPMHVAAALGRPVVAVFGPTHPGRTGPYGQASAVIRRDDLLCSPCLSHRCGNPAGLECLEGIDVSAVAGMLLARLSAVRQRSPDAIRQALDSHLP